MMSASLLLVLRHVIERNPLGRLGEGEDLAGVLVGKKALRHHDKQLDRRDEQQNRSDHGRPAMPQHPREASVVDVAACRRRTRSRGHVDAAVACSLRADVRNRLQSMGVRREGNEAGDQNRHADRDGEFVKQPPQDAAHEQHRDKDGRPARAVMERIVKPISFEPSKARPACAALPCSMWRTMFSSITMASSTTNPTASVSAMSERLSSCSPADTWPQTCRRSTCGSARLGMTVAERLRRNRKMTRTTSAMVRSSVNLTSSTDSRMDTERSKRMSRFDRRRHLSAEDGQKILDAVHHLDRVGAGLALDRQDDRPGVDFALSTSWRPCRSRRCRSPCRVPRAARACRCGRPRSGAIGRRVHELAACLDGERLGGPLTESPSAGSHSPGRPRSPLHRSRSRGWPGRWGSSWARTAYFWEPNTCTWATPLIMEMRWAISGLRIFVDRGKRQRGRTEREVEDRLVGGIDLLVSWAAWAWTAGAAARIWRSWLIRPGPRRRCSWLRVN